MLEFDQATIDRLLNSDTGFRRLYDKHCMLNAKVDKVTAGDEAMEQLELETLKKEKLAIRDRLQAMLRDHALRH